MRCKTSSVLCISLFACFACHADEEVAPTRPVKVTVVDQQDRPVTGVVVRPLVSPSDGDIEEKSGQDGSLTLELPAKNVAGLLLVADDGERMGSARIPWSQEPPATLAPVSITLKAIREMPIRVVDGDGCPVAGATVLLQSGYREAARVLSDQNGEATLRVPHDLARQAIIAMKPGAGLDYFAYRREGEPASHPQVLSPDHDELVELVLNGSRQVTVTVVDQDDQPLAGAHVYPWLYRKPNKGEDLNMSGINDFLKTDQFGVCTFEVPIDLDRATTVWVRLDGYAAPERATFDPKSIDSTVRARLEKMVQLSGQVQLPDGVAADEIEVLVTGDGHSMDGFRATHVEVNDNGTFQLLVNRNMYYQLVAGDNKQWASAAVNVIVLDEPVAGVDLELVPATRIHGNVVVKGSGEPVADQRLQLYQRPTRNHYELPEGERLPNPGDSNRAVNPIIHRGAQSDAEGRFEFYVGPGSYYIRGPRTAERPDFVIESESEKELLIEVDPIAMRKDRIIPGKVVLAASPGAGVPNASVFSYPTDAFSGDHVRATSGDDGTFEAQQILSKHLIHARATIDGEIYAGIAEISPDDDEYVINIARSATLNGRLVEKELDLPLEGRQVRCGITITYPGGSTTSAFGGSATTDEDGRFTIDGLIPGRTYTITVTTKVGADGQGRSFGIADQVQPEAAETIEREFPLSAIDYPPTFAPVQ